MKKLKVLLAAAVLSIAAGSAFALNVELDVDYFYPFSNSYSYDGVYWKYYNDYRNWTKETARYKDEFTEGTGGFTLQGDFYFFQPKTWLEIGLNAGTGIDFYKNSKQYRGDEDISSTVIGNNFKGTEYFFNVGPAFRFNANEIHSFVFTPAFKFNFINMSAESNNKTTEVLLYEFMLNFDIGYRCFLVRKDNFNFGISAGINLGVPLFISFRNKTYENTGYPENYQGFIGNFYIGTAMNFGKRNF